jgi:hypothetical protein
MHYKHLVARLARLLTKSSAFTVIFSTLAALASGQAEGTVDTAKFTLSCRLQVRAYGMSAAKSVTDEILLPVTSLDTGRSRDIEAAHTDVIDVFGGKPLLSFDILEADRDGKVPLLINFVGNYRGMTLRSNFRDAGFDGEIGVEDRGFTLLHPDALAADFPGIFITFVAKEPRNQLDLRERISVYCGRTSL